MQRVAFLKDKFLSFDNLYLAYKKAYRGTKNYSSYVFAFNIEKELFFLKEELSNKQYNLGDYQCFKIYDPKERVISVAPFRDRIVHHALVNVLDPIYEKRFIFDSYATRISKGTHKAVKRAQKFMQNNYWYLKMDIRKYFDSIDHDVLKSIIKSKIKDNYINYLLGKIIEKGGNGTKGLPIGNLTSQFFANVYLDVFDHYIKDELSCKFYLRYMDDFCIFSNDKEFLKILCKKINNFLNDKLKLELKKKATLINNSLHGLAFLGVRIYPKMIRIKKENFNRSFNKLKTRIWEYNKCIIEYDEYDEYNNSVQSLVSYLNYYGNNLLQCRLYNGIVS